MILSCPYLLSLVLHMTANQLLWSGSEKLNNSNLYNFLLHANIVLAVCRKVLLWSIQSTYRPERNWIHRVFEWISSPQLPIREEVSSQGRRFFLIRPVPFLQMTEIVGERAKAEIEGVKSERKKFNLMLTWSPLLMWSNRGMKLSWCWCHSSIMSKLKQYYIKGSLEAIFEKHNMLKF